VTTSADRRIATAMQSMETKSLRLNSARVLFRFGLRPIVLLDFAMLGPHGYANALFALFIMCVVMCAAWAAIRREPLFGPALSNWDEAAAYGCLAALTAAVT
jgi:hypothetical protein